MNLGPLEEQYLLLTFELSFQPGILERSSKLDFVIPQSETNSSQVITQSVGMETELGPLVINVAKLIVFHFCLIKNQLVRVQQVRTVSAETAGCPVCARSEAHVDSLSMELISVIWTLQLFLVSLSLCPWATFSFPADGRMDSGRCGAR